MSWPEAIFYSVLVICGLLVFLVLLAIVLVARAFATPPPRRTEPTPDYRWESRTIHPESKHLRQWLHEATTTLRTSVQPETDIDPTKTPRKSIRGDVKDAQRQKVGAKEPTTEFRNPYDGVDFTDAAKKAMERDERYRKAKEAS